MNNEQLQKWALMAEIIGGIAILATLVILVFELRQNTSAVERAAFNEIAQSSENWRYMIAIYPEIRNAMSGFNSGNELTADQEHIVQEMSRNLYSIYQRAFWANQSGQMGDSEWERIVRSICSQVFWDPNTSFLYTDEFVSFIRRCP